MNFDTIVVGAGIAGLTAAYQLQKAGQKVLVLEKKICRWSHDHRTLST